MPKISGILTLNSQFLADRVSGHYHGENFENFTKEIAIILLSGLVWFSPSATGPGTRGCLSDDPPGQLETRAPRWIISMENKFEKTNRCYTRIKHLT